MSWECVDTKHGKPAPRSMSGHQSLWQSTADGGPESQQVYWILGQGAGCCQCHHSLYWAQGPLVQFICFEAWLLHEGCHQTEALIGEGQEATQLVEAPRGGQDSEVVLRWETLLSASKKQQEEWQVQGSQWSVQSDACQVPIHEAAGCWACLTTALLPAGSSGFTHLTAAGWA